VFDWVGLSEADGVMIAAPADATRFLDSCVRRGAREKRNCPQPVREAGWLLWSLRPCPRADPVPDSEQPGTRADCG
jgi:hypothetical protein